MITHLEPDIVDCKVKWALGNVTTNKAGGGDQIPVELLQNLKDDSVKVLHSIASKFEQINSGHSTVFIPIPKIFQVPHSCTHLTR